MVKSHGLVVEARVGDDDLALFFEPNHELYESKYVDWPMEKEDTVIHYNLVISSTEGIVALVHSDLPGKWPDLPLLGVYLWLGLLFALGWNK